MCLDALLIVANLNILYLIFNLYQSRNGGQYESFNIIHLYIPWLAVECIDDNKVLCKFLLALVLQLIQEVHPLWHPSKFEKEIVDPTHEAVSPLLLKTNLTKLLITI